MDTDIPPLSSQGLVSGRLLESKKGERHNSNQSGCPSEVGLLLALSGPPSNIEGTYVRSGGVDGSE